MEFYRYEDIDDIAGIGVRVKLRKFNLLRETPEGYWITPDFLGSYVNIPICAKFLTQKDKLGDILHIQESHKKWVSKTSKKRYAYPTKKEAAVNFFKRKELQVAILSSRIEQAKQALSQAGTMLKEEIK